MAITFSTGALARVRGIAEGAERLLIATDSASPRSLRCVVDYSFNVCHEILRFEVIARGAFPAPVHAYPKSILCKAGNPSAAEIVPRNLAGLKFRIRRDQPNNSLDP